MLTPYLPINPRRPGIEARVNGWALDRATGRINALDVHGNMVMAIPIGPLFALRLVAAFRSPSRATETLQRTVG